MKNVGKSKISFFFFVEVVWCAMMWYDVIWCDMMMITEFYFRAGCILMLNKVTDFLQMTTMITDVNMYFIGSQSLTEIDCICKCPCCVKRFTDVPEMMTMMMLHHPQKKELSWSIVDDHEQSWRITMDHDLSWSIMIDSDPSWSIMIDHDRSWSIMIHRWIMMHHDP